MSEKLSEARVQELLEKEAKLQKVQDRQRNTYRRRNAKLMIFKRKAEEKGITVSEKEIDEYLK